MNKSGLSCKIFNAILILESKRLQIKTIHEEY
jgi:hypothetical protein